MLLTHAQGHQVLLGHSIFKSLFFFFFKAAYESSGIDLPHSYREKKKFMNKTNSKMKGFFLFCFVFRERKKILKSNNFQKYLMQVDSK